MVVAEILLGSELVLAATRHGGPQIFATDDAAFARKWPGQNACELDPVSLEGTRPGRRQLTTEAFAARRTAPDLLAVFAVDGDRAHTQSGRR